MTTADLEFRDDAFALCIDRHTGGVKHLRHPNDSFDTNFVVNLTADDGDDDGHHLPDGTKSQACALGDLIVAAKWEHDISPSVMASRHSNDVISVQALHDGVSISYMTDSANSGGLVGLSLEKRLFLTSGPGAEPQLNWTIKLTNRRSEDVEVQDLGFPLPMNSYWGNDQTVNYEQRVHKHSFVAGHGSYLYWQRPCGEGRILVLVPSPDTSLEFKHRYREDEPPFGEKMPKWEGLSEYYIHSKHISKARVEMAKAYLPASSLVLTPGQSREYGFAFVWARDFADLRSTIYRAGGLDAVSLPGMVIPRDQAALLGLRSQSGIRDVRSFDKQAGARIERIGSLNGYSSFRIHFDTLGEHYIKVFMDDRRTSVLQYFCVEPIEALIEMRAEFLVRFQQVREQCGYDGAFLQWDMSQQRLLTWENYSGGGWKEWMVGGSDDLGLAPAVFLSQKCLFSPQQRHVEALDYHIERFLLGYLVNARDGNNERTFQVYRWYDGQCGTPRDTGIWRAYNYTHIANLMFNMYQIAKAFPAVHTRLCSREYLRFSFEVLNAMYSKIPVPNPIGDAANTLGLMGESLVPEIIVALLNEGMGSEAARLEEYIRRKLRHYQNNKYPFASEMTIDTTGFESVYRLAKWFDAKDLAEKSQKASIASRGLQPLWYFFGSDNRMMGESYWNLGYETQLGAWQQLDYLENFSSSQQEDFDDAIRSTYGAYLAGWANINSGQIDGNPANIGAASWLWQSEGGRGAWPWMPMRGQWWAWSGEADLGFWGGLRTAAVSVVKDPVFGLYAFGGDVSLAHGMYTIIPKDGVRGRLTIFPCANLSVHVAHARYTRAEIGEDGLLIKLVLSPPEGFGKVNSVVTVKHAPVGECTAWLDEEELGASALNQPANANEVIIMTLRLEKEQTLKIKIQTKLAG